MKRLLPSAFLGGISFLVACGGPEAVKGPVNVPEAASAKPAPRRGGPSVSQELGSIDPKAADKVFQKLQGDLMNCQKDGLSRVDVLSGDVKFFVRIGHDGRARYAYLEETTLGDRATEKCMLDVVMRGNWPQPEGGDEAEARKSYGFDPASVREPTAWSADKVAGAVGKHEGELKKCTRGATGFKVTAYVAPVGDAGKEGKALSVGVSTPNKEALDRTDCIVEAVKGMKFPSPGSYPAKVTFNL
ncbi:MAG: AgmX/PglI C-terminal domain-containing protein [Polyangiaceae bacterium]